LMSCLIQEIKKPYSDYYYKLSDQAQENLVSLSYYCVFQAMIWKNNDTQNGLVFLEKALSYWKPLSEYSLEMQ